MLKVLIFLCLFILLAGAEGQLFESLFSKRSSQDEGQSGFVEDTSKHFLSLLFTPFNNNQQYEGGGRMLTGLFSPARSGSYDNYKHYESPKASTYGNYHQGYGRSNNDFYTCEGCNSNENPPPPPSRQVSSGGGADYTCTGCDKYPTQPKPPPVVIDYSCKGCNGNTQKSSSRLQEYYPASTSYNEHYQTPKVYHEVIGYHKKPKYSVIDTRLRIPPVKFRVHLNPKIVITTNTQDPLAKTPHHHVIDDDDYIPPPEVIPHHHHHSYGHDYHHHHHTSRQSNDHHHHHHHHEEPYGAHITKHDQPIRNKYERSFAIKLNPEIYTDPPPTRPPTTTTTRPRSTTSRSRTREPLEISPRLQSVGSTIQATTTTTTTTTTIPSPSSDTRASLDGLREAAESGLSPLEVLIARRRRTTTTTEPPKTQQLITAAPSTIQKSTATPSTTLQQREMEETTIKTTAVTEAASNNEVEVKNALAVTMVEKIIESTTLRPTQDPRVTLDKLREAAEAGLSPFEVLLSRNNSKSKEEKKLSPRNAETN